MDKFESLALWMALEISKNSDGDYAKLETRIAWSVWQSRQTEVDALNDNHLAYIDKVIAMESDYLEKIEEKDKQIKTLITTWRNQAKELCNVDDKHVREALLSCADELEVLRGEHEA